MGIEFTSLDEFEKKMLRLAKKEYPQEAKKFMRQLARDTIKIAKIKTPKGPTGNLKRGWKVGKLYIRDNSMSIVVKNIAPHAHLIEKGHQRGRVFRTREGNWKTIKWTKNVAFVPGNEMLAPALKKIEVEIPQRLKNWITKMIQEVGL
ncbi:hypothetical protein BR63_19185 [Thermanaerosceptrum fracticalcis]|uniref:HK97 gp10 family phage protein n=1 Tax=Thermanaerosceptrum fracticalcis TaxID=1712410 RepID=A0A7G6E802_THEFR|nr:HK97 gp10 family phage protein [Thermanaerosceptrum fracticalcis]QNB48206.1 hypothetical protein BR63_19185 [Thermanaerosceptrum fracticalcis]